MITLTDEQLDDVIRLAKKRRIHSCQSLNGESCSTCWEHLKALIREVATRIRPDEEARGPHE